MSQKNGCYLVITHSRTCAAVTKVANMGWYTFPIAPIVSATTTADKVTVTY